MALCLSGSSSGIHKSWQYSILGKAHSSQEDRAHTGATEVARSTGTQKRCPSRTYRKVQGNVSDIGTFLEVFLLEIKDKNKLSEIFKLQWPFKNLLPEVRPALRKVEVQLFSCCLWTLGTPSRSWTGLKMGKTDLPDFELSGLKPHLDSLGPPKEGGREKYLIQNWNHAFSWFIWQNFQQLSTSQSQAEISYLERDQ